MPATALTKTAPPGFWSTTGVVVTMTAADVANGNDFAATGKMLIIVHNTHATTAYTFTITSSAHSRTGRTGNVAAQSLAAGEIRVFIIVPDGWKDSAGKVNVSASNAAITIGVMNLP